MKVIDPTTMQDSLLLSTTVSEADHPAWVSGTNYTVGTKVIRTSTHRIYENLVAGVSTTPPENATGGATPVWLDLAPTNRWAMFDNEVGSKTTATTSMQYVLSPGMTEAISFLELDADSLTVLVKSSTGGSVIYNKTFSLDGSAITGFYDWFFEPYSTLSELSITDLPVGYFSPEITITITGTGSISCGVCKFGLITELGGTEYGATIGIISYSKKEVNEFGRTIITPRSNVKTLDVKLFSEASELRKIYKTLSSITDKACVWIGTDKLNYETLTVYGFYKDFSINIAYPTVNYCTLQIEGII